MNLMRVTAVDYEIDNGELLVQLTGRDENGERPNIKVQDTVPYFYAREDSAWQLEDDEDVREIRDGYESFDGVPLCRIDTRIPGNVSDRGKGRDLTEGFDETWESDIPFYRRVSIDYDLSGHIRVPDKSKCSIDEIETDVEVSGDEIIDPRILIADIEVLPREDESFEEMTENYEAPISHISMWDSYEDEYIALHLDPDGRVDPSEVSALLDEHSAGESLSPELDRDIHLKSYTSESDLLSGFLSVIEERGPDLISGWNFVDFDWDYIINRIDNVEFDNNRSVHDLSDIGWVSGYNIERKADCRPAFDMMDAYKKMTQPAGDKKRSYALDYIGKEELDTGKIPNVSITWAYEEDRDLLVAYNIMDTMLCVALDRAEGIHDFFYELAEISQVQIYDTFSEMRLIDGRIMSRADDDEILPTMEEKDIPENAGGLVLNPSDGVKEWVGTVDLASLYPSVFITWNLSPETIHWYDDDDPEEPYVNVPWLPDADHADGGNFPHEAIDFDVMWSDLSEQGLIPKYLKELFPERQQRKDARDQYNPDDELYDVWDRKQYAVKVLMNSFYGVSSNDYWRLGKYGLGDAITSAARYALWQGKEIAEDEGYEVYYGDTDSVMLSLGRPDEGKQAALTRGESLEETLNSRMDFCIEQSGLPEGEVHPFIGDDLHGTDRHALEYEFEKLYRRFFQAGNKKRYAGSIVWKEGKDVDGEIDMVGFESQRSDSPELTEEIQPEVVNRILSGEGFAEVSEYVRDLIDDIKTREMDLYKVAIPASLGNPLVSYGNTQTARACRFSNKHFDHNWSQGDNPWVYFIDTTPAMSPGTDVLALDWDEELPEGYELDMSSTLDRACKGPLKPILREVGWRWTEVKKGAKTQSAAEASWSTADTDDDDEDEDPGWGW